MMKIYFLAVTLLFLAACTPPVKRLPILGHRDVVTRTVNGQSVTDTVYQTIPDFAFLNQDSVLTTENDFAGKIYVADFFFTRCPSICPPMHRNMLNLYKIFKDNPDVKFLSHSIDPDHDRPAVLKTYAAKLGLSGDKWLFVTGSRDSIYAIAEKSYLVAAAKDDKAPGGYIHQGYFVLVDKERRLRGAYDGVKADQADLLAADMKLLLDEYKGQK